MKSLRRFLCVFIVFAIAFINLSLVEADSLAQKTGDIQAIDLTQEELLFIQQHPKIGVGVDPAFVPYEFFDSDSKYKGIAADYLNLIRERTGIEFTVAQGLTWNEAYEKAVNKELDVLSCVSKTTTRERYFLFSEPYFEGHRAIFMLQDSNAIKSFDDLKKQVVAVQANSSHHTFLSDYDEIELSLYTTVEEALQALSSGREFAFVGNLATSSYLIKTLGITNLKYVTLDFGENQLLYFAVRNDWPQLVGILNKALSSITEEEKIEIRNKWIDVEEKPDYSGIIRLALIIGSIIAIVLFVSVFWIVRLKKEMKVRKRVQEELRLAKDEADWANQTKSMFLARMSHEIRTPLNGIMGMSYLMKKTDLTTTQAIYLDKLMQAGKNMLGIINDILDFSKIEAGKIEIEKTSFVLDNVLQRVINIESVKIGEHNLEFLMEKSPNMPQFYLGDPVRLEQILLNIVNNAIKFTSEGSVTLSVHPLRQDGGRLFISFCVADTGIGMDEQQLERLFLPFDQGDSSINRRFGGTGLGMSIVKSLTDLMEGSLDVSSVLNEGSTFCVTLPFDIDVHREETETISMAADCFSFIRALIFEAKEEKDSRLLQCIHAFGIRADYVRSEGEAFNIARDVIEKGRAPYNLVLVDHNSSEKGGIECIASLKRSALFEQSTKFILIAPMSRDDLFEEAENARIDFTISKPIIPSVLYNGIVEIFNIIPPQARIRSERDDRVQTSNPYHILVVDDNKTNQFIAQNILTQAGFLVSLASDGEEGCRFVEEKGKEIDLILMDIHMPVMDGYTASDFILKIKPDLPIIAMTADAIAGVNETCKKHGMNKYVSKPFDPESLIETILLVLKDKERKGPVLSQQEPISADTAKVLDQEDALKRIGNDFNLLKLILKEFYKENLPTKEALSEAIEQRDFSAAGQIIHKIKSSAGNIGAQALMDIAVVFQQALKDGLAGDIEKNYALFIQSYDELIAEINRIINE